MGAVRYPIYGTTNRHLDFVLDLNLYVIWILIEYGIFSCILATHATPNPSDIHWMAPPTHKHSLMFELFECFLSITNLTRNHKHRGIAAKPA